jgi:ubiquinone biosynthesis monooxygenase Coq7
MAERQTAAPGGNSMTPRPPGWRPGDARADIGSMIRVDQAGEYGATRIYAGQLAVLGNRHPAARSIARMAAQEDRHLRHFDEMLHDRGVRPTLLQPFWNVAGHALGAVTAFMSPNAAMACTAAVETEIDKHYAEQLEALGSDDPDLSATIAEFQAEELEHRETAIAAGAEQTLGYPVLSAFIRAGCRAAIALSKRI